LIQGLSRPHSPEKKVEKKFGGWGKNSIGRGRSRTGGGLHTIGKSEGKYTSLTKSLRRGTLGGGLKSSGLAKNVRAVKGNRPKTGRQRYHKGGGSNKVRNT